MHYCIHAVYLALYPSQILHITTPPPHHYLFSLYFMQAVFRAPKTVICLHEIHAKTTSQISQMRRIRVIASIAWLRCDVVYAVLSSYRHPADGMRIAYTADTHTYSIYIHTCRIHTAYASIVCSCGILCRVHIRMHSILLSTTACASHTLYDVLSTWYACSM